MELNYDKDSKERIPYEHYMELYRQADPERSADGAGFRMTRRNRSFSCG